MKVELDVRKINILKHSLGYPKFYRNHFVTGEGSTDFEDCEELVDKGLMVKNKKDFIPDFIYTVTKEGKEFIKAIL